VERSRHWTNQRLRSFVHHLNGCRCPRNGRTRRRDIRKGARLSLRYARFADIVTTRIVKDVVVDPALLVSFCDWMRSSAGRAMQLFTATASPFVICWRIWEKIPARLMRRTCGS
jgi:hypothetical protein